MTNLKFSDASIVDHDTALIESKDGSRTNGLCLTVKSSDKPGIYASEILLTREELNAALLELEENWNAIVAMGLQRA